MEAHLHPVFLLLNTKRKNGLSMFLNGENTFKCTYSWEANIFKKVNQKNLSSL